MVVKKKHSLQLNEISVPINKYEINVKCVFFYNPMVVSGRPQTAAYNYKRYVQEIL